MSETERPLSNLLAQGWEVQGYSFGTDAMRGVAADSFLLRRQKQVKVLRVSKKHFGKGYYVQEIDL